MEDPLKDGDAFTSPKGELAWVRRYGPTWWLFPNWRLDLTAFQGVLQRSGYQLMVHLEERVPPKVKLKRREGVWNWKLNLN
jgi:putative protease